MSHYSAAILADSPLRYYRLNEPSGTTAADIGSQALNGTLNGGITLGATGLIVNEPAATSMTLNGTSGYISAATTGLPTAAGSWTLEAWVNMASVPGTGIHAIVEFGSGSTNHAAVIYLSGGTLNCNTYAGNTITGLAPSANKTYHIVGCYDGTNLRLYINGALQGSPLACTPAISLTYCRIGSEDSTPDDFFGGSVQEVAIYGTALSATQVRTHFTAGLLLPTSNYYSSVVLADSPIRYYRLGEASGTWAVDSGSQLQPGAINGGVTLGHVGLIGDSDLAMTFDGSTGYISLPLTSLPTGNNAWSLEAWVNLSTIPGDTNFRAILSFGDQSADTGGALYLRSGALGCNVYSGAHTVTGLSPVTNKNYHLVGTYASGTLTFYINGVSQGSVGSLTLNIGSVFAYIGCEESPRQDFIAAVIDEVAIYSTALSAARVLAHYQAARGVTLQRAMHKSFGQVR
jgi:hypothetical protein